jgi:preprotein translocase subunit YajC
MLATVLAQASASASSSAPATGSGSGLGSILFLVVAFGALYLFMIRPNQQRRKRQMQVLQTLEVGDEVNTAAGMFGKIIQLSDEFAWVEFAPGTTIKMLRRAVIGKVGPVEEPEPEAGE